MFVQIRIILFTIHFQLMVFHELKKKKIGTWTCIAVSKGPLVLHSPGSTTAEVTSAVGSGPGLLGFFLL